MTQEDLTPLMAELPLDRGLLLHRTVYNRTVRDYLRGRAPQRRSLGNHLLISSKLLDYRSSACRRAQRHRAEFPAAQWRCVLRYRFAGAVWSF